MGFLFTRVEYLEASVGVSSKKNIVVPQLLQWHMKDFTYAIEYLKEWIYSELPKPGSLKPMDHGHVMFQEKKSKAHIAKMVEIQTYMATNFVIYCHCKCYISCRIEEYNVYTNTFMINGVIQNN